MNTNKCLNCHLVNHPSQYECQRCGFELVEPVVVTGRQKPRPRLRVSHLIRLAVVVGIGYAAYIYFGGGDISPVSTAPTTNRLVAQPQPTLSLRAENEQRQTGAYKNAVQGSSGLAQSQKHVEETQKLMQAEPAKQPR